jgi:hypothetical protein
MKAEKGSDQRKQAFLLAFGFFFPYAGGIAGEVLGPFFFGTDVIPVTTPLFTVFSLCSIIAMMKYNLLEYSPRQQECTYTSGLFS